MATRGLDLRRRGPHHFLAADRLQRGQVLLRGFELGARLRQRDLRFFDELSGNRPFLEQLLAAVEQLLRRIRLRPPGVDVGLRLGQLLRHRRRRRARVRLGLRELAPALGGRRHQIAILELDDQLSLLDVIAPVDEEAANRCADLRSDGRLVQRIEDRVRGHDVVNGAFHGLGDLDGCDRLGFGFFLPGARRSVACKGEQNQSGRILRIIAGNFHS